jgi:hypothetical protein
MKPSLLFAVLGFLGLFVTSCASVPQAEIPGTLKVQVNMPPTLHYLAEDRIATAMTDRVREVFQRQGFDRPVEEIRPVEDSSRAPYLLTINLTEWRVDRLGNIDCAFSAELRTPAATRSFGPYTNTALRIAYGSGRFGWARGFEDAADGALRNLCLDVLRAELLPNLRRTQNA